MTISEIAVQTGVAPETLVQEVCKQQTEMAMLAVVCGLAFAVISIIIVVIASNKPIFAVLFTLPCLLAITLLSNGIPDYMAWKTAPETTANQYIVEHYGGGQE